VLAQGALHRAQRVANLLISTNQIGNLMKIDVHQHIWTEPLVQALAARSELPFVREESGLTVLYLAGERPYVSVRT
jgi:hypothetical protein